ncbi:unconventional myosin-Va isoform X2 [Nasonia vitripennis]|uniref:Uncharacterized protein n=1 Tax=Nasonia vitripennis TaxID=7425 RepID=A0A7M7J7J6_NASVI|nr:unconventional myosin-Va isoform X2 [Nasonia vitripennis]
MSTESLYKKGFKVWIPHVNKVWEWAVILEDYNIDTKILHIETGLDREIKILIINSNSDLPHLCNSEDFFIDEKKNLASLRSVHEASVLNNLRLRFEKGCVYTYCGVTAVFINPFLKPIPREADNIFKYRGQTIDDLRPHIFALAEKIYCRLERENRYQSLIFTGKSGAGKTENAKLAILYLATISAEVDQMKDKITASSTILEAFGNAKTIGNDNSSRFGKFMEMQYDANYHIVGASIRIFLLDRSRVVNQIQNEQNYNIFYELCSVHDRFPDLHLNRQEFCYLNTNNSSEIYSNYSKRFDDSVEAFKKFGFTVQERREILKILAAILHLGNLNFTKFENLEGSENLKGCFIAESHQLEILEKLLSLNPQSAQDMKKWMCHKKIFSNGKTDACPMSIEEAVKARDSLAKFIYRKLFIWIVSRINYLFFSSSNFRCSIGILDVYGFEKFDVNLFEQFCINYVNEKIQQTFIQMVFKLEQEEYLRDNIGWSFIKYQDNRLCLELLEGENGIIHVIDQESNNEVPRERPWINAVFESTPSKESKHFERPKCNDSTDFIIHHFIDYVQYDSREFLEKNEDKVSREHIAFLRDSNNEVLLMLLSDDLYRKSIPNRKKRPRSESREPLSEYPTNTTLISELKESLIDLTKELQNTTAHYVRCIKSNDERKSYEFDAVYVAHQIRKYNVLDAIQLSSMGYFSRQTYANFFNRYYCLCEFEGIQRDDLQETCRVIIYNLIEDSKTVKFGVKYIFLKEEIINHLENLRREKLNRACIIIQKAVRRILQQKRNQETRRAVLSLQTQVRNYLIRRRQARGAAEDHALVKNETRTMDEIRASAATEIQRLFRGFRARRFSKKRVRDIITIQTCIRRFLAQVAADKLRENRIGQVHLLNEGLKAKIGELQRDINAYMDMNLTKEQLDQVQMIAGDQQCFQAKNRLINEIIIRRIQNIRDEGKKVKPVELPVISEHQDLEDVRARPADIPVMDELQDLGEIRARSADRPAIDNEDLGKMMLRPADLCAINDEDFDRFEMKTVNLPIIDDLDLEEEEEKAADHPVLNELQDLGKDLGAEEVNAINLPVMNDLDLGEEEENSINLPVMNELDLGEEEVNAFNPPVMNEVQLQYENSRTVNENSLSEVFKSLLATEEDFSLYQPLFQACFNFDQRMEKLMEACGINRREVERARPAGRNDGQGFVLSQGMFQFEIADIESLLTHLIGLPTLTITNEKPGLPSRILFMCLRYLDCQNDFISASLMLEKYVEAVESLIRQRGDLETFLVWLVNTYQLLNYLKQYARVHNNVIDQFQSLNTNQQTEHCLVNLNLESFCGSLLQLAESLAHKAAQLMKTTIFDLAELGILEYNPASVSHSEYSDSDGERSDDSRTETNEQDEEELEDAVEIADLSDGQVQQLIYQSIQELAQNQPVPIQEQEQAQEQEQNLPQEQEQALGDKQELAQEQNQVQEQVQEPAQEQHQEPPQELEPAQEQEPIEGQEQAQLLEEEYDQDFLRMKRNALLQRLTDFHLAMETSGLDANMRQQMFKKLFDFMSTILLSYILSHPQLCNVYRGAVSRVNLRAIERWARYYKLNVATIALGPIKQALRLLQMQPMEDYDVFWIDKLYDKLNSDQILRILSCYKPAYAADQQISPTLMQKLKFKLERWDGRDETVLINSEEYPVIFPFRHCSLPLEEVEIPATFDLPMLRKI